MIVERVFAGDVAQRPVTVTAPPTPMPVPVPVTSPITPDGSQLFLQLGAFSAQENATIFRDRMARELEWNREPISVVFVNGLWRVRMGPYTSRTEAEAIQARVKDSHDFSPVISKP